MDKAVQRRIGEFDFLKCVFILLMIVFHLVYIGDKYPYAKDLVYTFHIPAFLLISGYLMNVEKSLFAFLHSIFWILVPYFVMENGYVVMSSILPVRGGVDVLTFQVLLEKIFLSPMGPYWYLHTLMLCGIVYYLVFQLVRSLSNTYLMLVILGLSYAGLSYGLGLVAPSSALYFAVGAMLKQSGIPFLSFFKGSWWSVVPFFFLSIYPVNLDRFTLGGMLLTYLAISIVLGVYNTLPVQCWKLPCYIGRHSLLLLVFSPLFTMAVKPLVPYFDFDSSGMAFLFASLFITVIGCFAITWVMDKMNLSRFFFGEDRALQPY